MWERDGVLSIVYLLGLGREEEKPAQHEATTMNDEKWKIDKKREVWEYKNIKCRVMVHFHYDWGVLCV